MSAERPESSCALSDHDARIVAYVRDQYGEAMSARLAEMFAAFPDDESDYGFVQCVRRSLSREFRNARLTELTRLSEELPGGYR